MAWCRSALTLSGVPFMGPIGGARVGYINGEYVLNPGKTQLADSQLDLVVAGTEAAVLMVESEAQQLSEEVMLGGVVFGHEQGNIAINAIHDLVRDAGKPAWDWKAPAKDEAFIAKVTALAEAKPSETASEVRASSAEAPGRIVVLPPPGESDSLRGLVGGEGGLGGGGGLLYYFEYIWHYAGGCGESPPPRKKSLVWTNKSYPSSKSSLQSLRCSTTRLLCHK